MTTNRSRWRTVATVLRTRPAVLAAAALAAAAIGTASIAPVLAGSGAPATAVADHAAPSSEGSPTAAAPAPTVDDKPSEPASVAGTAAPEAAAVEHVFQLQPNYYYCGPAAARVALSAHGKVFSQDRLAGMLGTTTAGTPSAFDLTRVLNEQLGADRYRTVELAQRQVSDSQIAQLKTDVVNTLSRGDTLVINIMGTGTDVDGERHAYPVGHYINVVAYADRGETVRIADSAEPDKPHYEVNVADLARWAGSRGYSAAAG